MVKQTIMLTYNTSVEVYGIYDKIHLQLCERWMKPSDSYFTAYTNPRNESRILLQGTVTSYEVLACMKGLKSNFKYVGYVDKDWIK